jgi:hypothetical protein
MAEAAENSVPVDEEEPLQDDSMQARFLEWVRTELVWYAGSFTIHLLGLSMLLLIPNSVLERAGGDVPSFDEVQAEKQDSTEQKQFEKFDIGDVEEEQPKELDVDPTLEKPGHEAQTEEYNDDNAVFEHKGGGTPTGSKDMVGAGGFNVIAYGTGPKVTGAGGIGVGLGTGKNWGSGGDGVGFGGRGSGHRKAMLARAGGNKHTERAVTGALVWLANHQMPDGSWNLQRYTTKCRDNTCTGQGQVTADAGATAMGVLPFLAAGQTHKTKGPYRGNIGNAVNWLIRQQEPSGNLAKNCVQPMYSHGLATIALCEAYGLSGDRNIGAAAQGAVNYIINAQNKNDGGWRYNPGDAGDTSVVGWQIMALKSAQMAGLSVGGSMFAGASKWLDSVQSGPYNSLYAYQPGQGHSNTMTSVGLLCRQYLGAKRADQMMTEGTKYLLGNLPEAQMPNIYYWYYASQVLHNMNGYEWDQWNRRMRKILIDTQVKDSSTCANGSWNPNGDLWGSRGGRVMQTALSALTLEIYYRYLPLFKANEENPAGGAMQPAPAAK